MTAPGPPPHAHSALGIDSSTDVRASITAHPLARLGHPNRSYTDTAGDPRDALPANPIAEADSYNSGAELPAGAEGSGQNHQGPSLRRLDLDDSCLLVTFQVRLAYP